MILILPLPLSREDLAKIFESFLVVPKLTRKYVARLECELFVIFFGFSSPGQEVLPRVFRKEEGRVAPYDREKLFHIAFFASISINKLFVVNVKRSNLQLVHMGLWLKTLVQITPL